MCQNQCNCGKHDSRQVVALLPGTDCGKCGSTTCLEFADTLIEGSGELEACALLCSPHYTGALIRLQQILSESLPH